MRNNYQFKVCKLVKILGPATVVCHPIYNFPDNKYTNTQAKFPVILAIDEYGDTYRCQDFAVPMFDMKSKRKTPEIFHRDYFRHFQGSDDSPNNRSILEGESVVLFDVTK